VPTQLVEHVVEERHTCTDGRGPGTIKVEIDLDVGLGGLSLHGCGTGHGQTSLPSKRLWMWIA
jgi:hypothetical protein